MTGVAFNRVQWSFCVVLAVVPFVLFLVTFWLFAIGDPAFGSLLGDAGKTTDLLIADAAANLRVGVLRYGSYVYVHVLLCAAACCYYLWSLRARGEDRAGEAGFQIGFAAVFAFAVCLVITLLTVSDSPFSRLVVVPYRAFALQMGLDGAFLPVAQHAEGFLFLAILLPTLFGTVAVVLASAAFHRTIFRRALAGATQGAADPTDAFPTLRLQVTLLSGILVSSVITARAYFHLFPALVTPDNKAGHALFADFAEVLSMACGLLYTATLIMAFAPGAVLLVLRCLAPASDVETGGLHAAFEAFKKGAWYDQLKAVLQTILTLVAPALASPLMQALSNLASAS